MDKPQLKKAAPRSKAPLSVAGEMADAMIARAKKIAARSAAAPRRSKAAAPDGMSAAGAIVPTPLTPANKPNIVIAAACLVKPGIYEALDGPLTAKAREVLLAANNWNTGGKFLTDMARGLRDIDIYGNEARDKLIQDKLTKIGKTSKPQAILRTVTTLPNVGPAGRIRFEVDEGGAVEKNERVVVFTTLGEMEGQIRRNADLL
jgi:hypothetical protein